MFVYFNTVIFFIFAVLFFKHLNSIILSLFFFTMILFYLPNIVYRFKNFYFEGKRALLPG